MSVHTILLADDSRLSRMLLTAIAADTHPDARIIEVEGGREALQKIEGALVTLAVIDLNMPDMDGMTLSREILKRFPQAVIGLISADLSDRVRKEAAALGIRFIPKPITEERISAFLSGS